MRVKIKRLREDAFLPEYAHGPEEDAGLDLRAVDDAVLAPGEPKAVATGLAIELPAGFEAQVREPYRIARGERIAQIVVARYERIEWEESSLADSLRGEGGFGSSGR